MNRPKKRDPRRRGAGEPARFTPDERRILRYLAGEFEKRTGRWPEPGDVVMLDDDGSPVIWGTDSFPARPPKP